MIPGMTNHAHDPSAAPVRSTPRRRPRTRAVRLFEHALACAERDVHDGVFGASPPSAPVAVADPLGHRRALVTRLERAVRAERARGAARHPAYDVARHARLARDLDAARRDLGRWGHRAR